MAIAPPDRYADKLVEELGVEFVPLRLDGKGTGPVGEARSLLALFSLLRRLRPAFVFNFTIKANIYSGLVCRLLRIPYANNVSGLGTAFLYDTWLYRRVRSLYAFANRGAERVFFPERRGSADLSGHRLAEGHAHGAVTRVRDGYGAVPVQFRCRPRGRSPL